MSTLSVLMFAVTATQVECCHLQPRLSQVQGAQSTAGFQKKSEV